MNNATNNQKIRKRDLTQGSIVKHIIRMAIPMTIGITALIGTSLADTYFVGMLGDQQLAAVSYTMPVVTLLFNSMFGMAIAMSAVVSRKVGAGEVDDVKIVNTLGITMALILAIVLCGGAYIGHRQIFTWLGATTEVRPYIDVYMPYILLGMLSLAIPIVGNSAIRGMGDTFWPAFIMITVALVNVVLDPILIFGLLSFPAMGIEGAGIATMVANFAAATIALMVAYHEKLISVCSIFKKSNWKMASKLLLVIAIPVSLANMIAPIVTYGYTAFLSPLGYEVVAGFGVFSRLEAFALIPIMAVAGGMSPVIGQNFGAKKFDRVNEVITKAMKFSVIYGVVCAACFAIFSQTVSGLFSDDPIVHDFIAKTLLFVPISYVGLNIFLLMTSAMNAMQRAKTSLVLNLVKSFMIMLPLAWGGIALYGENGFVASMIISNIIAFFIGLYCFRCVDCFKTVKSIS